jgi:hypothetical protein
MLHSNKPWFDSILKIEIIVIHALMDHKNLGCVDVSCKKQAQDRFQWDIPVVTVLKILVPLQYGTI